MRTLPSPLAAKALTLRGTDPLTLVEIDWSSGTAYYADKTTTFDGQAYEGRIISMEPIRTVSRVDTLGTVGVSGIVLSDIDGDLKGIYDTEVLASIEIRVYQTYGDLSDRILIIAGIITSPIIWSEAARTLSCHIETPLEDQELGFSLEDDRPIWPIVFGDCMRVPAAEVEPLYQATLQSDVNITADSTTFDLSGTTEDWPESTSITIMAEHVLGNVLFTGTLLDGVFTVTRANAPYYSSIALDDRPVGDTDQLDPSVLWLADSSIRLEGLYCYINYTGSPALETANLCTRQEGAKCWFEKIWRNDLTTDSGTLLTSAYTIEEACPWPDVSEWGSYYENWFLFNGTPAGGVFKLEDWAFKSGTKVYYGGVDVTYVANLAESEVPLVEVMAYRSENEGDEPRLVPVPSSYFEVDYADADLAYGTGHVVTSIYMTRRLTLRYREGWQNDNIYVSLRSTLDGEVANVILHLVNNYTSFTPDMASFVSVSADTVNYPTNFALLGKESVLPLINRIAWEGRCLLYVGDEGNLKIKYLSKVEAATQTYDEAAIQLQTLNGSTSETMDLVTKYVAKWRRSYAPDSEDQEYVYMDTSIHPLVEKEETFRIYNQPRLVKQSIGFWGNRHSNIWRKVDFVTFLNALSVEGHDTNAIQAEIYSSNTIRGNVTDIGLDTATGLTQLSMLLASKAGSVDSAGDIDEDETWWTGDPDYPISPSDPHPGDPLIGLALVDYEITPWPIKVDTSDTKEKRPKAVFTGVPSSTTRGTDFEVTLYMFDSNGNILSYTGNVTISMVASDTSLELNTTSIYVENGTWTGNLQVTGGSGPAFFTLRAIESTYYTGESSDAIEIDPAGEAKLSSYPPIAIRDTLFTITLEWGTASASIGISLITSGDDDIYDDAGVALTTVTTDIDGTWTGSVQIKDGTGVETVTIRLNDDGVIWDSNLITVFSLVSSLQPRVFIGKITGKSTGMVYDAELYPEYPTVTSPWVTTVTQLNGSTDSIIPTDTMVIVVGILDSGGDPEDPLDYGFFIRELIAPMTFDFGSGNKIILEGSDFVDQDDAALTNKTLILKPVKACDSLGNEIWTLAITLPEAQTWS